MDLKKFLPGKKIKDKGEYLWAIVIEPSLVQAGIWRIQDNKAQVVFKGVPSAWELDEELVVAVDTALSSAIQDFSEDGKDPSKTVFGVISSWVSGGEIKEEYLSKVKKICSELSLTPVGFVVLPEAIAHFIKSEDGSPLSAVVLGVYKQSFEISVFRLGNLAGSTKVARSVSITDDVAEGLSRFGGSEPIPSRFVVYDGKEGELEEVKQSLLKANWEDFKTLKFLHTPKIEMISLEEKVRAVSLAGASEMADVKALDKGKQGQEEEVKMKGVEKAEEKQLQQAEKLGFVLEKDVLAEGGRDKNTEDEDFSEKEKGQIDNVRAIAKPPRGRKGAGTSNVFRKIKNSLSGIARKINILNSLGSAGRKVFISGFILLLLILVSGFAWWWYYPKATVTIYVSPRLLKERVGIFIDPEVSSSNITERVFKGRVLTTEVEGEKTGQTSGTKTVGDQAKGEVTIYRVGDELTLDSGTIINGPSDLKFSLDEQVVVASGSASSPGNTKTKVTASEIGSQYNLASDTSFTVANYSVSDLEAKNESSFSGGTSHEIRVVSVSDQEDLQDDLEKELNDKALNDLKSALEEGVSFVDESLDAVASSVVFSDKVGDEAASLKLTLTLEATALSLNLEELHQFSQEILRSKIPEGFVLRDDQTEVGFEFDEKEGELYKFDSNIEANLLPEIDVGEVAEAIKGRYPALAKDYLTNEIPGFVRAEIKLKPKLPSRLSTLPRIVGNIDVVISAER